MTGPTVEQKAAAAHALECYKAKRALVASIERLDAVADFKLIEGLADEVPYRPSRSEKRRAERRAKARR